MSCLDILSFLYEFYRKNYITLKKEKLPEIPAQHTLQTKAIC